MIKHIKFYEGTEDNVPKSAVRLSAEQVETLNKVFQDVEVDPEASSSSTKGVVPTLRPRCHIIACYVDADFGVTCWYHCV